MTANELRAEPRIGADVLPERYRSFLIFLPGGREATGRTMDASLHGIGFLSDLPPADFTPGCRISLSLMDRRSIVFGDIVDVTEEEGGTRVGLCLLSFADYSKYRNLVQGFLEKPAQRPLPPSRQRPPRIPT